MTTLEVRGLTRTYHGLRAVDDVSFTLTAGRTVALVGASGSGKSTIATMIARLVHPTSGEILMTAPDGVPVPRPSYRDHVQMLFQDPFASLNPFHTVEHHLARARDGVRHLRPHQHLGSARLRHRDRVHTRDAIASNGAPRSGTLRG